MGKSSNTLTIRRQNLNLNLLQSSPKLFVYSFLFLEKLKKLFAFKGLLLTEYTLNFINNQIFIKISSFFRTNKLLFYKRKTYLPVKKMKFGMASNSKRVSNFLVKQFKLFNTTSVVFSFININKTINQDSLSYIYSKTKKFSSVLFLRRFNLFIDFIKLTALFSESKIPTSSYLYLIGQIFKVLPKKKHSRFIFFFKYLFKLIVENNINRFFVKGIKLTINGKLSGKTRASVSNTIVGSVPIQSLSCNIKFAQQHVYTLYGAFGFKIWVHF